jgi:hypothetical protein
MTFFVCNNWTKEPETHFSMLLVSIKYIWVFSTAIIKYLLYFLPRKVSQVIFRNFSCKIYYVLPCFVQDQWISLTATCFTNISLKKMLIYIGYLGNNKPEIFGKNVYSASASTNYIRYLQTIGNYSSTIDTLYTILIVVYFSGLLTVFGRLKPYMTNCQTSTYLLGTSDFDAQMSGKIFGRATKP